MDDATGAACMNDIRTGEEREGGGQLPLFGLGVHPHQIALRLQVQPRVDHQRHRPRMPATMARTSILLLQHSAVVRVNAS